MLSSGGMNFSRKSDEPWSNTGEAKTDGDSMSGAFGESLNRFEALSFSSAGGDTTTK